ncbi:hypothetical protein ES695_04850 [Candidatus Atribacteria bacterium 1244-E10-H5-B2]|nr:MAG: hypothetical protein ES695_04850 [Candidatus Atribacteria bacterium 1244-E10-H5-B2]
MIKDSGSEKVYKTWKRAEDIIEYRSEKAREIISVIKSLPFHFALVSDKEYRLDGYEIIRLINIIMTVKRKVKSLNSFEKLIRNTDKYYRVTYLKEVIEEKKKNKIRATDKKTD